MSVTASRRSPRVLEVNPSSSAAERVRGVVCTWMELTRLSLPSVKGTDGFVGAIFPLSGQV